MRSTIRLIAQALWAAAVNPVLFYPSVLAPTGPDFYACCPGAFYTGAAVSGAPPYSFVSYTGHECKNSKVGERSHAATYCRPFAAPLKRLLAVRRTGTCNPPSDVYSIASAWRLRGCTNVV